MKDLSIVRTIREFDNSRHDRYSGSYRDTVCLLIVCLSGWSSELTFAIPQWNHLHVALIAIHSHVQPLVASLDQATLLSDTGIPRQCSAKAARPKPDPDEQHDKGHERNCAVRNALFVVALGAVKWM